MVTKNLARLCLLLSTTLLTSVLVIAQDTQQPLRDKFLKDTTHTSSQPVRQPQGFFKPFGTGFYVSTAVCVAGAVTDISTSQGKQELNPILRNNDGSLNNGRAILLKLPACFLPVLFERRHPKLAFWARTVAGISWGLVAMRN